MFDVNKNGLSLPRTINQVLNIVYAGGNHSGGFFPDGVSGGFFPDGVSGTIFAQMT